MNLTEYAAAHAAEIEAETKARAAKEPNNLSAIPTIKPQEPHTTEEIRAAALHIVKEYKINKQVVEGCKLQILHDLKEGGCDYSLMLLCAAESISRMTGEGDNFYLQVQQLLNERKTTGLL